MVKKRIHVAHQLLFTTMTIYFFPFKKKYIVIAKKKKIQNLQKTMKESLAVILLR